VYKRIKIPWWYIVFYFLKEEKVEADFFNLILEKRLKVVAETLNEKAHEYSGELEEGNNDRLHNFKRAAEVSECTPRMALYGMFMKHFISFDDIMKGKMAISLPVLNEKITDMIAYLILAEATIIEEIIEKFKDESAQQSEFDRLYEGLIRQFHADNVKLKKSPVTNGDNEDGYGFTAENDNPESDQCEDCNGDCRGWVEVVIGKLGKVLEEEFEAQEAETPKAKKPVAKKPVAKKPVAKKPAKKPVAKKPVAKKPVAKKPAKKK